MSASLDVAHARDGSLLCARFIGEAPRLTDSTYVNAPKPIFRCDPFWGCYMEALQLLKKKEKTKTIIKTTKEDKNKKKEEKKNKKNKEVRWCDGGGRD
ncbi:hypothetical protein Tco_0795401 [Tanacetum coccineum]